MLQPLRLALCTVVAALCVATGAAVAAPAPDDVLALRTQAGRLERGDGLSRDLVAAAALYCQAAKLGDPESQFQLGWIYSWGRGVPRKDGWAAYLFEAAADQGIAQAPQMLRLMGGAAPEMPECMREAPPALVAAAAEPEPEPPKPSPLRQTAPKQIVELVMKMAPEYRVQPDLVLAIIKNESNFDTAAVSPKNAQGLMQLIPETAERFAVKNPHDARQNIRGGMAYLRWLLAYFEGDLKLVAAAYNAGEGAVDRYLGVPPYSETRNYVRKVLATVGDIATHPFDASVTRPSPRLRQIRDPQRSAAAKP